MSEGVKIPVSVTGAEQAKAEIRGVKQEIAQGGDSAGFRQWRQSENVQAQLSAPYDAAARGAENAAARGAENATEKTKLFTREGRILAATLLTEINPALGSMVLLLSHVVKGVADIGAGLIALAGGAALLGGVLAFFTHLREEAQALAEAIQRVNEALRAAREAGGEQRARLAQVAWALGLFGRGPEMQRESTRLQNEGIIAPVADNTALARQVAGREGIAFDPDQYMRGLTTRGMKPIDFAAEQRKAISELRRVLIAGLTDEAARAFETAKWESAQAAQLNAPNPAGNVEDALDTAMHHLKVGRPDMKPEELAAVERLVREGVVKLADPGHAAMHAGIVKTGVGSLFWTGGDIDSASAALGGTQTVKQLVDSAKMVAAEAGIREGRNDAAQIPTTQPMNINVYNTHHVTNVDSAFLHQSAGDFSRTSEQGPGGGIEN